MQLLKCEVALNGDMRHSVPKSKVTPAEILVLQFLHGSDAVTRITRMGESRQPHAEHLDYLRRRYNKPDQDIISHLFPGALPRLPGKLSEIGMAEDDGAPGRDPEVDAIVKRAAENDSKDPEAGETAAEGDGEQEPPAPTKATLEFAAANGIDLAAAGIEGTGKNGRITKGDVESYLALNDDDEEGEDADADDESNMVE